jgi:CheY-like chemotaxis protein
MMAFSGRGGANERGLAEGLVAALKGALAAADPEAPVWRNAADVADLLRLSGLAALLKVCRVHASSRPADVVSALDRVSRLVAETEAQRDLAPFVQVDRELAAMAEILAAQQWVVPPGTRQAPVALQSLGDLLADLTVDDAAALARCTVSLQVGAGVRAAIDWLEAEAGGTIKVVVQDAVAMLSLRIAHEAGLAPAGAVLALTGGALLPETDGRWTLRVPLYAERPAFLLARQGALSIAIPWHAVARLRIAGEAAREALGEPSLTAWSPLQRAQGERPAALIAQGLSRAWLHLDHIVWRIFAAPEPGRTPAEMPGAYQVVRTEQDERYFVLDANLALREVPALETPAPRVRSRVAAAPAEVAVSVGARVSPSETHEAPARSVAAAPVAPPALVVLGRDQVQPLARAARSAAAPSPRPTLAPVAPRPRRALVVDDSLVARLALMRVLEGEGWIVEAVESAAGLWHALEGGSWDVVFIDVSLPDARGREHLAQLVSRGLVMPEPFAVIALARDASEERLVQEAGIAQSLRKPFAPGVIEELVRGMRAVGRS